MDEDIGTHSNDALAERMADYIVELARKPGLHRLEAMQMAGLVGELPTKADIARAFNLPLRKVYELENRALAILAFCHPELRHEIQQFNDKS